MSNQILTRDSYVKEIYVNVHKEGMNEGIFDFFNTLMKKEWNNIKSKNSEIKSKLEEIDRSLKGFTLIKMKKSGDCAEIRQLLCDFANTLWESKEKELEDGKKLQKLLMGLKDKDKISDEDENDVKNKGKVSEYMKQFNIKDKALSDKLKTIEKRIDGTCKKDPDLLRWTDILKDEIRNIINDMIIKEYDKEEGENEKSKKYQEELKKQEEEQKKEREEASKKAQEEQEKAMKEIEKERENTLSSVGIKPLKNQTGDKAVDTLTTSFNNLLKNLKTYGIVAESEYKYSFENIINESKNNNNKPLSDNIKKILKGDVYFGFNNIEKDDNIKTIGELKMVMSEIKVVFDKLKELTSGDLKNEMKEVPSDAIQAMFVGISKTIQAALSKDCKLDDATKTLLARCCIGSDKTIGYGLPFIDKDNEKNGNIFTALMQTLKDAQDEAGVFKDEEVLSRFHQNMSKIYDEILKEAESLKEKKEKEDKKKSEKIKIVSD